MGVQTLYSFAGCWGDQSRLELNSRTPEFGRFASEAAVDFKGTILPVEEPPGSIASSTSLCRLRPTLDLAFHRYAGRKVHELTLGVNHPWPNFE